MRAGGPAPRGHWLDIAVGILGALMLVAAVALAQLLPDKTYLNPQFRFSGVDVTAPELPSQRAFFEDAGVRVYEFEYEVTEDNVKSIAVDVGFVDDVSYSLPDRFLIDLVAPNGTTAGWHAELQNPDPRPGVNASDNPSFEQASMHLVFNTAPAFPEQIVTGLTHTELPEQVLARLAPDVHIETKGIWKLRVELVAAQDCPDPGAGAYPQQFLDCRVERPGTGEGTVSQTGDDPGNEFIVTSFVYTYYVPDVQELK